MNYKLIIADDEPLILIGLQSMLDWASFGISIAGVARNGEQLMELIEAVSPDLVITDIKMPVRSGLDVMRECSERFGRIPLFIILTSHEEYGYVKEAISCQAVNYLVKIELTSETLTLAINRSLSILRDFKRLEPVTADGLPEMQPYYDRFYVRLINGLFENRDQYLQQSLDLGIDNGYSSWFVAYCGMEGVDSGRIGKEKLASLCSSTVGMVRETVSQYVSCIVFSLDIRYFCILFCFSGDQKREAEKKISNGMNHAMTLVRNYFAVSLHSAVGGEVNDLYLAHESFDAARKIYSGDSQSPQIVFHGQNSKEGFERAFFDMGLYRDALSRAFQELDFKALAQVLDRIVKDLSSAGASHAETMDAACGILYMAISLLPDGEEIVSGVFEGVKGGYRSIYEYKSVDDCNRWIETLRDGLFNAMQNSRQDYRIRIIAKVQRYIDNNVGKHLSLSEVASIHGFSQNYLSLLFSRFGGCSFVEYTTRAKIKAAKKMMAGGELKIHEIAERLGFESAFYFSKVFKKIEGMSPHEYMQQVE